MCAARGNIFLLWKKMMTARIFYLEEPGARNAARPGLRARIHRQAGNLAHPGNLR